MADFPYMQFFVSDWTSDPRLSMCAPATRGIWIDALCAMHANGRVGELSGTVDQLARICRCSPAEMTATLSDLEATKAADVTKRNGVVTLICRRMQREAEVRAAGAERVRKHRNGGISPQESIPKRGRNDTSNSDVTLTHALNSEVRDQNTESPNPQPQAAGGEREDGGLSQEKVWQRVCGVVRRDPAKPKSPAEVQALGAVEGVTEADMQIVEQFAAAQSAHPKGSRKGKWLAHTLLEGIHAEVGKARLWLEDHGITPIRAGEPPGWPEGSQIWLESSEYAGATWTRWSEVPAYVKRQFESAAPHHREVARV